MADIQIHRSHSLGLAAARKVAFQWAEQAETEFGMACVYEEGKTQDTVRFTRSGVDGQLLVSKDGFELDAKLGFLLGAFKHKIEAEIVKNLDQLLSVSSGHAGKAAAKPATKTAAKPAAKRAAASKAG